MEGSIFSRLDTSTANHADGAERPLLYAPFVPANQADPHEVHFQVHRRRVDRFGSG